MGSSNSKKQAEFRKRMAAKGYSRIPVYAPTNARELIDEIVKVTTKMVEEYEEKNKKD